MRQDDEYKLVHELRCVLGGTRALEALQENLAAITFHLRTSEITLHHTSAGEDSSSSDSSDALTRRILDAIGLTFDQLSSRVLGAVARTIEEARSEKARKVKGILGRLLEG